MSYKQLKSIAKFNGWRQWLCCLAVITMSLTGMDQAKAVTYVLPHKSDDVIGQIQYAQAKSRDTLLKIARQYDVGYAQIKAANPGVDPKNLKVGQRIVIPSRFILPRGARTGIVINISEQRLYYYSYPDEGPALVSTYPVSFGPEGKSRQGTYAVTKRLRKPSWEVPATIRASNPRLPEIMPPGKKNPLGEYGMELDGGGYMIHGTNNPYSIGMRVSRGSIRLYPEDIAILVHRVNKDTPVRIINDPFKYGYKNGVMYFEIHKPESTTGKLNLAALVNKVTAIVPHRFWAQDWQRVRVTAEKAAGIGTPIAQVRGKTKYPRRWILQLATYKHYSSARKLMLQLEELGLPVTTEGCDTSKCRVLAGPFRDATYMKDMAKRIKWITRIKSITIPYKPPQDELPELDQTVAHTVAMTK